MASHSAPLAKRPHSPSTSNSPPAKRRAHSPEEGEVDDGKLVVPPSACSRSSSPYANGGESPSRTGSTSPSQSHAEAGLTKNSKHAFPFASTANNAKSHPSPSGDRDRDRNRGDFYRPSSPRHRSGNHNHSHNAARHAPGYDSYRPGADTDSYRPSYRRSRSRSGSRSRPDSASPVARRHRLPPRPASPPPQPPLHSSYSATSYERSSGGGYERANSGGHDRFNGGTYDRNSSGDRWAASQSRWDGPNNSSNSNGRGRTRNPYADSGPSTRGTTPNPNTAGGLRPLDTPGAPLGPERVGTGMDMNRGGDEIGEDGETGSKEEGEEQDNVGPRDGKADSWEPRPDRGRDGGRSWEREREKGRDDSRGWTGGRGWDDSRGRTQDRERGRNLERGQPPPPPPPPSNGNTLPPPAGDALPPQLNGSAPPPPPLPVDPKIEEALNDTIARVMREADEADAKRKEGGGPGEKDGRDGGAKPKVLRRTAEQEMQAYGRKFVGTSQIRDYAIADKLGEGTFGEVHKASHIVSKRVVALKRILMHNEKEGVPVTALREIKILKMLSHPSVVTVCDMVVEAATRDRKGSIYMVFPYMDHDLAGLLENPSVKFSPSQIKLYMRQLLEGTEYLHQNKILHRDLKAANLLINNQGSLQIADFGLARPYSSAMPGWDPRTDASEGPWEKLKGGPLRGGGGARYTNCVVTRWYRPPELLMGEARYGCAIDMWGVGCIMGEMWTRRPILCGNSDADQLEKIWELCGTPDEEVWPGWRELPGMDGVKPEIGRKIVNRVRQFFSTSTSMDEHGVDLVFKLLTLNPATRTTAFEALDHDYFWTEPLPCDPSSLPKYTSSHEYDKRKHKGEAIAPQMSMAGFSGPPIPGPGLGLGPGPNYPLPPPQMPGHPPMMHGPPGFRPPGPWGGPGAGPGPGGPPFNQHMSGVGGRGGGRGGFGRGGGRGFHPHHQQRPPPNPGPNFNSGPGPGNGSGPPINFSGYVRPGEENASGPGRGGMIGGRGGGGGGSFLPPPLGTHSREHRQMRERNMRMNGHGPNGGGHRGGPPSRMGDFPSKPSVAPPPPNANGEFLPYG